MAGFLWPIIFGILAGEMALWVFLLLPLPLSVRKGFFNFLAHSRAAHSMRNVLFFTFFVLLLVFGESLRQGWKYEDLLAEELTHHHTHGDALLKKFQYESQKFRAQRNMYISGFAVFLLFVLDRYIKEGIALFKLQEEAQMIHKQQGNNKNALERMLKEKDDLTTELKEHKDKSASANRAIASEDTLKKQAQQQQQEYLKVLEEKQKLEKQVSDLQDKLNKKSDVDKKTD